MIEKSSGRLVAGRAAPVVTHLTEWILKNPSFQVLVSGTSPTSHSSASFYNKVNADSKQKKESDKKSEEDAVRSNVRRVMKDILVERKKESSEIRISVEGIMKLVRQIEENMYKAFKDTSHRYKAKYRTLMFNLKDSRNKVLYRRVLTGDIPPEKLIWMTSDELATKELAQWREQETKHMIDMIRKEEENTNKARLIKKTHKGEVDVDGDEDLSTLAEAPATKEVEEKKPKTEEKVEVPIIDTTEEHRAHLFDLNCKICTGKMAPPGEIVAKSPTMSSVPIQAAAESSIPSPPPHQDTYLEPLSPDSRDTPSDTFNATSADKAKETTVWKGFVMMQNVAKFGTNAYLVSGSGDNLIQILPDTLHVHGRIAHKHVWDYVKQCKTSSSRELCIIRFAAATDEEKISYVSLYSYFHSRKRCGVIGNCYSGVKDMYLVPLASHEPIPSHLLPFTGPGLQEPRPHMLLGLIVKNKGAPAKRARSGSDRASSKSLTVEPPSKRSGIDESGSKETTPTPQVSIKPSDSPVDEIEDIVFHYHNTQGTKPEPAKPAQSSAIPPMISALLKIQEQEKRLRELQMQSELLEKELAPKMANIAAPSGQTSSSGRSNPVAVPQSLKGIASFTATAPHPAVGSSAALLSVDGPKGPSVLSVGVSSTVLASVGQAAGSAIQQGTTKHENDDNEPYDPETASNEEAPYDPEDLEDINLSLDEVPSPDKTETNSAVIVPQSALSKTVTPSLVGASIAETMEKDKVPSTWSKPEADRLNQHNSLVKPLNNQAVANVISEISMKAGNMNQRSIPRELEEKVQALLKPGQPMVKQTNVDQHVAKTTSDIPPRDQYDEQRLSRGELERMRMEQGRGDPILPFNHSRDFPERRDLSDRRGYREDPAYNNDGRRGDPKFYSSRYSLNARRGSDERSHDKAYDRQDHYRSRDYRGKDDDRHWDDRGRDEKHRDEHFNRNRDRFSRDRWRR